MSGLSLSGRSETLACTALRRKCRSFLAQGDMTILGKPYLWYLHSHFVWAKLRRLPLSTDDQASLMVRPARYELENWVFIA